MKRTSKPSWKTVSISAESRRLMQKLFAQYNLTGVVPRADGRFDVRLDGEVLMRLREFDADIDKAIECLCQRKH